MKSVLYVVISFLLFSFVSCSRSNDSKTDTEETNVYELWDGTVVSLSQGTKSIFKDAGLENGIWMRCSIPLIRQNGKWVHPNIDGGSMYYYKCLLSDKVRILMKMDAGDMRLSTEQLSIDNDEYQLIIGEEQYSLIGYTDVSLVFDCEGGRYAFYCLEKVDKPMLDYVESIMKDYSDAFYSGLPDGTWRKD